MKQNGIDLNILLHPNSKKNDINLCQSMIQFCSVDSNSFSAGLNYLDIHN